MGNVHGVHRPSRLLSGATALSLSLLFIVVYGLAGWVTSLRGDVGTWVFEWERDLPFVPWLIVPYMSLDLFYVAAPFLCADRAELRAFRRRMTMAIVVAGAMFLLVPLRFAFERPLRAGWTRGIFQLLYGFDRPTNLFPSLHIVILMIVWGTYYRHTRGTVRWLIQGWFSLVGLSTVFTYQHHVIDILGGAALGLACYYLIPERKIAQPATTNPRIGVEYAMGATILAAAGLGLRPWGLALWWPALSMAIVAGAYFGLYAGITQKNGGRISGVARIVLAPWLAAQRASLIYYRGHAAPWQVLSERVCIGRQLGEREAAAAVRLGVTAVVDLTGEFSEARAFLALPYLNLPILDLTAPTPDQIRAAIDFINAHRDQGAVYVHCKIGYSRSATVLGAWLIDRGLAAAAEEAVAQIRTVRPSLVVRPEALAALRSFQQGNGNVSASAAPLIEARA